MKRKRYYCRKCKTYHYTDSKKGKAHRTPKKKATVPLKKNIKNRQFLLGDFDGDNIKNIDDALPLKKSTETVEETKLSTAILKLQRVHRHNERKRPIIAKDFRKIVRKVNPNMPVRTLKTATPTRSKTPISILHKAIKYQIPETDDLIGLTYVGETKEELFRVRNMIERDRNFVIVETKNYYKKPKEGYKALHLIVKDKRFYRMVDVEEGEGKKKVPYTFEIQLKTKRMKRLNKASHTLYKTGKIDIKKFAKLVNIAERADAGDVTAKRFIDRMNHEEIKKNIRKKSK